VGLGWPFHQDEGECPLLITRTARSAEQASHVAPLVSPSRKNAISHQGVLVLTPRDRGYEIPICGR